MTDHSDLRAVERLAEARQLLMDQLATVIVGQHSTLDQILMTLFAGGHCLLVGVPGLAKTLIVRTLARCLDLQFRRIQFTPDLMPSDITGTELIQEDRHLGTREMRFLAGPIFANMILADEINRTPPKTQAALLEAMQEHQVTVAGQRYPVPDPFFVLATQNPIEQEGTYPLPEAQLDRFMLSIRMDYPSEEEELQVVQRTTADLPVHVRTVLTGEEILQYTHLVRRIPIADHVARYAVRLARSTRPQSPDALDGIRQYVVWGAGPRASQYLVLAAKARAALEGRPFAAHEDIQAAALPVMRHRLRTNFAAQADDVTPDALIQQLVQTVPLDEPHVDHARLDKVFRSADAG